MYNRCYSDCVFEQAIGVALEAWNLEKVIVYIYIYILKYINLENGMLIT